MKIHHDQISVEALQGLIEAHVLREGTDYGEIEHSFEDKCGAVRAQLSQGLAIIWFDAENEVAMIVPAP